MKIITIGEAEKLNAPNPFALVVTADENGRQNLMALSWWTFASNNPPTIAACLSKRGYSGTLIRQTGMFSLCLPGEALREAAFRCGTCSGRDVDKPAAFGIELIPSDKIAPMLVKESRVALECRVTNTVEAGDHLLFIASVEAAHGNPDMAHLLAENGYATLKAYS